MFPNHLTHCAAPCLWNVHITTGRGCDRRELSPRWTTRPLFIGSSYLLQQMAATAVSLQDGGLASWTAGAGESSPFGHRPFIVGYIWIDMGLLLALSSISWLQNNRPMQTVRGCSNLICYQQPESEDVGTCLLSCQKACQCQPVNIKHVSRVTQSDRIKGTSSDPQAAGCGDVNLWWHHHMTHQHNLALRWPLSAQVVGHMLMSSFRSD